VEGSGTVIADIKDLRRIVGANIRLGRALAGQMTQGELADRLDIGDYRVILDYEKGRRGPSEQRLIKLAIVLNQPLSWFFEVHDDDVREENGEAA
jgi:transcriptional regulator with XRE-family HTH domain